MRGRAGGAGVPEGVSERGVCGGGAGVPGGGRPASSGGSAAGLRSAGTHLGAAGTDGAQPPDGRCGRAVRPSHPDGAAAVAAGRGGCRDGVFDAGTGGHVDSGGARSRDTAGAGSRDTAGAGSRAKAGGRSRAKATGARSRTAAGGRSRAAAADTGSGGTTGARSRTAAGAGSRAAAADTGSGGRRNGSGSGRQPNSGGGSGKPNSGGRRKPSGSGRHGKPNSGGRKPSGSGRHGKRRHDRRGKPNSGGRKKPSGSGRHGKRRHDRAEEAERQRQTREAAARQAREAEQRRAQEAGRQREANELVNTIGMEFVRIEAGTFRMGAPARRAGRSDDRSRYTIHISQPFYLGKYEVTQGQWRAVLGDNPSHFTDCGDTCPVENVSWEDAQAFIEELNLREGIRVYRLPTEAEWEYATRAGTRTVYSFGNTKSQLRAYGWYRDNSDNTTHPVRGKRPNGWGLYDLHGNVWEWVADWYGDYPSGRVTDPQGPSSGTHRVIRGGGWRYNARDCRTASRGIGMPGFRSSYVGFRLARTP